MDDGSSDLDYENEDLRSSSPSSITMRQQLKDMFKHRPSRYNFLELSKIELDRRSCPREHGFPLDNNLAGDDRISHLKDRMRDCQKVFFNLKSALVKVEKQRKAFLRKQKPISTTPSKWQLSSRNKAFMLPDDAGVKTLVFAFRPNEPFVYLAIQIAATEILTTSTCT